MLLLCGEASVACSMEVLWEEGGGREKGREVGEEGREGGRKNVGDISA